tara:strand:+ start:535 stop:1245 length:711 start_codon:yes stop_codon:yes gene_type:complete
MRRKGFTMFLGLNLGKNNRLHPASVLGTLHDHDLTTLLQSTFKPMKVLVLLAQMGAVQHLAAEIMPISSIEYGTVATYHRVEWDHPQLPINILRGAPPAPIEDGKAAMAAANSSDPSQTLTEGRGDVTGQDVPETLPAVLYEIDLGEQGMLSVISAQLSVKPGHCAAIERGQNYLNLRRVHREFCDPANRPLTPALTRYQRDIATLCQTTKNQPTTADEVDEAARHIAQVSMLCDG